MKTQCGAAVLIKHPNQFTSNRVIIEVPKPTYYGTYHYAQCQKKTESEVCGIHKGTIVYWEDVLANPKKKQIHPPVQTPPDPIPSPPPAPIPEPIAVPEPLHEPLHEPKIPSPQPEVKVKSEQQQQQQQQEPSEQVSENTEPVPATESDSSSSSNRIKKKIHYITVFSLKGPWLNMYAPESDHDKWYAERETLKVFRLNKKGIGIHVGYLELNSEGTIPKTKKEKYKLILSTNK